MVLPSQNNKTIDYGEEGSLNPGTNFIISGNTILNDRIGSPLAVWNATTGTTAQITDNKFYGLTSGQIVPGLNTQSGNQFLSSEPSLDTSHPWLQTSSSSPPTQTGSGSSSPPPTQTGTTIHDLTGA